jgi:L-fucose isomerase-like protein
MRPIRVGLVPIVRPLFRGADMGLAESSATALRGLADEVGFALTYTPPPLRDVDEARTRAAEIEALRRARELDFLIIEHVTFATGDLIQPILDVDLPMAVWALPEVATSGPLPQNALCGLNLSLSLPTSRTLPVKWLYGNAADAAFTARLAVTVQALRGWAAVQYPRLLLIGGTVPGFTRLDGVPDVPLRIDRAPLDAVMDAVAAVSAARMRARLLEIRESSAIPREHLQAAARLELALGDLGDGYDGVALRCWPEIPDRVSAMPCAPFARLADRGCAFACEGDVAGLVSMLAVAAVTEQPAVLLDLSHIDGDALMFWHCGNAARAWAAESGTRLAPHFNRKLPAVRDMRLAPGPVSGARFLEGRKAVVYAGAVTERADAYDGASGWFGHLRWAGAPATAGAFLASILNLRLPHHLVWGRGDHEAALTELCGWLRHEVLPLDAESTALRWPSLPSATPAETGD